MAQQRQYATVKQVLSGDTVVVRGQPKGGPPPERTICLSNIVAPRLARRANPQFTDSTETKDEPYAWEAREFLRKKLVGQVVSFTVEYKAPGSGREYGFLFLGKEPNEENINELVVAEGFVTVRREGLRADGEGYGAQLIALEDSAKAGGKGRWGDPAQVAKTIRNITWTVENPRHFVDSHHGKSITAVVEHVRDACTIRGFLLPSFTHVTVLMSGIKAPMFKMDDDRNQTAEPFAEEAKFVVEKMLLQQEVQIILESTSNQNFIGSIMHPKGNIAEFLLQEGFARCMDWSMGMVTNGQQRMRAAEKFAKEKKKRIWKDYTPPTNTMDIKDKNFTAKVVEIVNGDGMNVSVGDQTRKIFLSSIRQPRPEGEAAASRDARKTKPLYDVPYLFEAREFLRKKLIGKKVQVSIDYIQPPAQNFPEKTCATVLFSGQNLAEALVSKGLATVVRYRVDDEQRSEHYDDLLAAEARAIKKNLGVHNKKGEAATMRVADVAGDANKAKQFLPFLQRAGRVECLVEFVASGSRVRVFIPRETCLVTLLLSGITCPRAARPAPPPAPVSNTIAAEPFGDEALAHTKDICLQHEVSIEVENMDRGGNFIGWLFHEGTNLSVSLVEQGLAKVHFTAERSNYYNQLTAAEKRAKDGRLGVWKDYVEPTVTEAEVEEVAQPEEPTEKKKNYKAVVVTEVTEDLHFHAQSMDDGPKLEELMEKLRHDLSENPPVGGAYTPRKGDLCAAKFTDGEWYRAKVQKMEGKNAHLLYVDYGNKEIIPGHKLASLPHQYHGIPPHAPEYSLAFIGLPDDPEARRDAVDHLLSELLNRQCLLAVEFKGDVDHVSLQHADTKDDVAISLVKEGLVLVEDRRERRFAKALEPLKRAQAQAKKEHLNLWRYGDITADDAREFGYQK